MDTASGAATYPVLYADVAFWYDNSAFVPSEIEEAWKRTYPKYFELLMIACKQAKPGYQTRSDAEAARAALTDVNTSLISGGVLRAEFGASTYKPGGQGHGGSARIIKQDGSLLETEITIGTTTIRVQPMIQVRIGLPRVPAPPGGTPGSGV